MSRSPACASPLCQTDAMREGADPRTLGHDAVVEQLVDAIQDGHLRQTLAELTAQDPPLSHAAHDTVTDAVAAVAAIDAAVAAERTRLAELLAAREVTPSPPLDDPPARPLHIVPIEVPPREVDRAAGVLEASGYRRLAPTTPGAWRAYRATRGSCTFVRLDLNPLRVELTWSRHALVTRGALGRILSPQHSDLETVAFPAALWPAYTLLRLIRLPSRVWRRHGEPPDLGPFLQTPAALIGPLLQFADLTASDRLVDLGCGDGRIVIAAAQQFGCRARGVETSADLVARARAAVAAAQVADRVQIVHADAMTAPLDDADVVVAFLPVTTIDRLLSIVLSRMKAGARVVAHEQERLHTLADARAPLLSAEGITVAHRWNR